MYVLKMSPRRKMGHGASHWVPGDNPWPARGTGAPYGASAGRPRAIIGFDDKALPATGYALAQPRVSINAMHVEMSVRVLACASELYEL